MAFLSFAVQVGEYLVLLGIAYALTHPVPTMTVCQPMGGVVVCQTRGAP